MQTAESEAVGGFSLHYRGCVICGSLKTHEHHIIKRKEGGVETISLCPKHHVMADRGKIPSDILWDFLRDRSIGWELTDDFESPWELEYHRNVVTYSDVKFHDFYNDEYSHCLYPPALHPGDCRVYRQCMVSLWLEGKRKLDIGRGN
jgi:hypothetical protein